MSITTNSGSITVTGKDGMDFYAVVQARSMLNIEIRTGMRHSRGSVLASVNRRFGTSFKSKSKAVHFLDAVAARMRDDRLTLEAAARIAKDEQGIR